MPRPYAPGNAQPGSHVERRQGKRPRLRWMCACARHAGGAVFLLGTATTNSSRAFPGVGRRRSVAEVVRGGHAVAKRPSSGLVLSRAGCHEAQCHRHLLRWRGSVRGRGPGMAGPCSRHVGRLERRKRRRRGLRRSGLHQKMKSDALFVFWCIMFHVKHLRGIASLWLLKIRA